MMKDDSFDPEQGMNPDCPEAPRYSRQVVLPEIGIDGQRRLLKSSVLVVGCDALGGHLAQTMVRAGIGKIGLIDHDIPEVHNLHRQVLFDEDDVLAGIPKATIAANRLQRINRKVIVESHVLHLNASNVQTLVQGYDLVLDGTDNFETRYVLYVACVILGLPGVYGGVQGTMGTMMAVLPGQGPCLRCILPEPPEPNRDSGRGTAGVLNTVPAMVAAFQCTEAFKILTNTAFSPMLVTIEAWKSRVLQAVVGRRQDCFTCIRRDFSFLNCSP
jgi:adenylyltransferase/sulfurtransferase